MKFKAGLAAMAILCAAPSQGAPVDIKGRWAIYLAPMVKQGQAMKASEAQIAQMKRTFQGGVMVIDGKTMQLPIEGVAGKPLVYKYKIVASKGNCVGLVMDGAPQALDFCIEDGMLHVHDPTTALTPVYRRR